MNRISRSKVLVGGIGVDDGGEVTAGGVGATLPRRVAFTLTRDNFSGTAGAVGTAVFGTIPAQARFDHISVTGGTGFLGNGSALISFGDGSDVDRYNVSGSINIFGTAANGYAMGDPSGTRYHTAAGTLTAQLRGTSAIANITGGTITGYYSYWF